MNPEVLAATAGALFFCLGFLAFGGALLRIATLPTQPGSFWRLVPSAAALGFAAYSYIFYLVLALRIASPGTIAFCVLLGLALGHRFLRDLVADRRAILSLLARLRSRSAAPLAVLSAGYLGLHFLEAASPPRLGDTLQGYMTTSRWLYRHGFELCPWNASYWLMPLNSETVFAASFALSTDVGAKLIDFFLGCLLLAGVYELASRWAPARASFFVAASLAFAPGFYKLFGTGKIDILSAFTFFQGFSLLLWPSVPSLPLTAIASFLVGTSCAQKYISWVFLPSFFGAVFFLYRKEGGRRTFQALLVSASVVAVCLLPHFAKNVIATGNPVAPFAREIFPSRNVHLGHSFEHSAFMSNRELLLLPYTAFFDSGRDMWYGWLPPLLLLGLCGLALARRRPGPLKLALAIAVLQLLPWVLLSGRNWLVVRFLFVPLTLLLAVGAFGLNVLESRTSLRRATYAAMIVLAVYFGIYRSRYCAPSWRFVLGLEDRAAWQERMAPERGYAVLHRVAPSLGEGARLFMIRSPFMLYNVPEEKLKFVNTEAEYAEYLALPDASRCGFLRDQGFRYFFAPTAELPLWVRAAALPEVSKRGGNRVLEITRCPAGEAEREGFIDIDST